MLEDCPNVPSDLACMYVPCTVLNATVLPWKKGRSSMVRSDGAAPIVRRVGEPWTFDDIYHRRR
eukprot:scaffold226_cov271-Pavlova_lutheri.AAC.1